MNRTVLLAIITAFCWSGSVSAEFIWTGKFARLISEHGIFEAGDVNRPTAGFVPYDVITPLFSDYAAKDRLVFLPEGNSAQYQADSAFDFPVGSAIVKTFFFPLDARSPESGSRVIESRLMIRTETGWTGAAYLWNDDESDAVLKIAGAEVPLEWIDASGLKHATKYLVPDMNQCKNCHRDSTGKMNPLGIKARHLNRPFEYDDRTENQLDAWVRLGLLSGSPGSGVIEALPRWDDPAEELADRAMAYMEVNCAHCHNPKGLAGHTGLDLRWNQDDPAARGIMKRPTTAGNAARDRYFAIVPGDPSNSFLLHRMRSVRPDVRMPPIGRTVVDEPGAALVAEWIESL